MVASGWQEFMADPKDKWLQEILGVAAEILALKTGAAQKGAAPAKQKKKEERDPAAEADQQRKKQEQGERGLDQAMYAIPGKTRVVLVPIEPKDAAPGVDLPTVSDPAVEISDGVKQSTMKASEVRSSPDYIDNGIQSLKAL